MRLRIELTLCIILFILGFCAGGYVVSTHTPVKEVIVEKNVEVPVSRTIYVPQTPTEWQRWADSPIVIDRHLDGDLYRIKATDGYKETSVTDRIQVGTAGNWKLCIGIGAVAFLAGGALSLYH